MHLVWFHRVLIAAAILFFAAFGISRIVAYATDRSIATLLVGSVSIVAAIALTAYLRRLGRFLRLPE